MDNELLLDKITKAIQEETHALFDLEMQVKTKKSTISALQKLLPTQPLADEEPNIAPNGRGTLPHGGTTKERGRRCPPGYVIAQIVSIMKDHAGPMHVKSIVESMGLATVTSEIRRINNLCRYYTRGSRPLLKQSGPNAFTLVGLPDIEPRVLARSVEPERKVPACAS